MPTEEETREIITPHAFKVAPGLLGLPLARPWRRGLAIAVDATAIGALSLVPGSILLLTLSTLLAVRARQISARRSTWLRLLGVVGIFVGVFGILAADRDLAKDAERFAASASLAEYRSDVESGECADAECARDSLDDLALLVSQQPANTQDADAVFAAHLKELPITRAEHEELQSAFHSRLVAYAPAAPDTAQDAGTAEPKPRNIEAAARVPSYSLLSWAQGLLQDLGLSLGWAALYFSAFIASWHGQTPGKRLLRIRVQMLNGGKISWWDAFSRYGGYGAGFATGLLGFLQVYWDPNRQAIQDKIVGTVVVFGKATNANISSKQDSAP